MIATRSRDGVWRCGGLMLVLLQLVMLDGRSSSAADAAQPGTGNESSGLHWKRLPDYPGALGVAGPFVGVHQDALIVAGGANFPHPVWQSEKVWHDRIVVLTKIDDKFIWQEAGRLERPIAYGTAVSTAAGVVCMGGSDADRCYDEVFLLRWDPGSRSINQVELPPMPCPCAYGQAALIGDVIYLAGGQSANGFDSAMQNFWTLDLSAMKKPDAFRWHQTSSVPGGPRAFNLTVANDNADDPRVYVMSGRRQTADDVRFLKDLWEYRPKSSQWQRLADLPRCVMAGTAIASGKDRFVVLGGADGTLFSKADDLKDQHPGFPKEALSYHASTDHWSSAGPIPQNSVTTIPVKWNDQVIIASGEVRPRVRSKAVWSITVNSDFGDNRDKRAAPQKADALEKQNSSR
mgnify:CR=1 FL=1|tara:strand:+ start:99971 stop:101182 length:1212 start_codon:yes stop_codon:yes gene_type:complete